MQKANFICTFAALSGLFPTLAALKVTACVAQLDRASDYGSEGLGFESLRVHDQKQSPQRKLRTFFMRFTESAFVKRKRGKRMKKADAQRRTLLLQD